ncbi:hypothetical protein ACVNPS_07470 [Candidatus Bipolaricaulota sp. J31]
MRDGGRFLARYIAVTLAIAFAIMALAALGLFLAGARDVRQYGNVFGTLGFAVWALGALSVIGSWRFTRSFPYQHPWYMSHEGLMGRAKRLMRDVLVEYGFLLRCFTVGAVLLGVGAWLYFR